MAKAWRLDDFPDGRPALDERTSVLEAAPRLLALKLAEVRHFAERSATRDDVEDLHALRVATRRLRATLALVGGGLAPLDEGVGRFAQALGRLRDRDVLLEWLDEALAKSTSDETAGVLRLVAEQRAEVPALETLVASARMAFEAHVAQPLTLRLAEAGFDQALGGRRVRARLAKRIEKVAAGARLLATSKRHTVDDVAEVHELRIAAKKVRYELELVHHVLDGAGDAIDAIKPLQESIGDLHDADVRRELLVPYVVRVERHEQPGAVRLLRETLAARGDAAIRLMRTLQEWQARPVLEPLVKKLGGSPRTERRAARPGE